MEKSRKSAKKKKVKKKIEEKPLKQANSGLIVPGNRCIFLSARVLERPALVVKLNIKNIFEVQTAVGFGGRCAPTVANFQDFSPRFLIKITIFC